MALTIKLPFRHPFKGEKSYRRTPWDVVHLDPVMTLLLGILAVAGLVILYAGSHGNSGMLVRQAVYVLAGFLVMVFTAQFSPRSLARLAPLLFVFGLALLVLVPLVGITSKGAQRWLGIPGLFRFQPSEVMKLALPLMMAWWLSIRPFPPGLLTILGAGALIAIPMGLVAIQPDLGTALIIAASGGFALLLGGLPKRYIMGGVALAVPAALVVWKYHMHDYQKTRVLTFLDPESDPLGAGWNIIQSKAAIGSGGMEGKGWMKGTQSQLEFLPEAHTDFIIAVFAEEFGFVGCIALLLLYLAIVFRGIQIAARASNLFGRVLAGALVLTFFLYIFINVGMVSGILPVVGVPLPLVSRGGTSVLSLMTAFGILMSIHSHKPYIKRHT
jgi:rod shape determining protein RodA